MSAATRISSTEQARATAERLGAAFADGAATRDRNRELPHVQLDELAASGLLAVTVPVAYGGADLPADVVADIVRILSAADANIAQIPHSHFVYLNLLRLSGAPEQQEQYCGLVLDGAVIANAQSERGTATIADIGTTLAPGDGKFRLNGTKYYCTGSLFADVLAVLARLDDPDGNSGLSEGEYIAFLPADTPGVHIVDDWNGLGQRTTGSGTITFDAVSVGRDQIVARAEAVRRPTGYGAFAQLLHAAIDVGIARGALETAAEFVRTAGRPWFEAGVARAADDPLLVQRFGELTVSVIAAEATLAAAGRAVEIVRRTPDATTAGHASVAVAAARVMADQAANTVASALFEVGGTRSAAKELNLDRYWRDARTHTLHDPVRWKHQHIGRATLHNTPPPLHGLI